MKKNVFLLILISVFILGSEEFKSNNMVFVKGGTFKMGSNAKSSNSNNTPIHEVTVEEDRHVLEMTVLNQSTGKIEQSKNPYYQ